MNFTSTNKIINHLDVSVNFLQSHKFDQGIRLRERWPELYNELVEITKSELNEDKKQIQRFKAFAITYKKPNDLAFGEEMLKYTYNQKSIIDFLNNRNDYFNTLKEFSDIEKEFWINCPDPNNITLLCNIYRERWRGHLYDVDENYCDWHNFLFDKQHELSVNFEALRSCGLITCSETEIECKLLGVAKRINAIVKGTVEFYSKMKRSAINTEDLEDFQTNDMPLSEGENNFNRQPLSYVRAHFKPLCGLSNNNSPSLSTEDFERFINHAFIIKKPIIKKLTLNIKRNDSATVKKLFGSYYQQINNLREYYCLHNMKNLQEDYLRLLTDNFIGYDYDKIMGNFSKYTQP